MDSEAGVWAFDLEAWDWGFGAVSLSLSDIEVTRINHVSIRSW